jgi:fibronectin-binding autotransporter adhesin
LAVTGSSANITSTNNPALGATIINSGEIISAGVGIGSGTANVDSVTVMNTTTGRIASISGQAFTGGVEVDTIDNSGRIEGAVTLGAGADRAVLRGGGLITGALDGGDGSDVLQLEVASGSALLGDRVAGAITNFELLEKTGAGTLTLTAVTAPRTALNGGTLVTNGALGGMAVDARAGTTLNVSGALGDVMLGDGAVLITPTGGATLSPGGTAVGTITLASLSLADDSHLRFDLGAPNVIGGTANDLINVTGNLVLDGLVDVSATPAFGNGVYRLINYGGTLTDGGLLTGTVPNATYQVQTAVAGQVNLVVGGIASAAPATQFWDGAGTVADNSIGGGTGIWNTTSTNWTRANGDANDAWSSNFAVFQGTAGTVTIAPGGVSATGVQFVTSGYRVEGGTLTLTAPATLRVGDGTAAGGSTTATIASTIAGSGGIEKTDLGTLILTGSSSYTGGTRVSGGTLRVAAGGVVNTSGVFAVGSTPGTTGRLVVTDAGSSLTIADVLLVGAGNGIPQSGVGFADVTAGGRLSSRGVLIDSTQVGGAGGTVTVSGTGTSWTNVGDMSVGASRGGELRISSGAVVNQTGSTQVANLAGSTASVSVTGANSTWNITDPLATIGQSGAGSLSVTAGGRVTNSGSVNIGNSAGASGTVSVSGAGSQWAVGSNLTVAAAGTGLLQVQDGAVVTVGASLDVGGIGAGSLTISGAGSRVATQRATNVGVSGAGTLTISNGGRLETSLDPVVANSGPLTRSSIIGNSGVINGVGAVGRALVTGAGSTWTTTGNIQIGNIGGDGALRVDNGATLRLGGQLDVGRGRSMIGTTPVGSADFLLTGQGTSADINSIVVGNAGGLGRATISAGAVLTTRSVIIGTGGSGNTTSTRIQPDAELLLTGAGTQWTNPGTTLDEGVIAVARNGRGMLRVADGAQLTTRSIYLGSGDNSGAVPTATSESRNATLVIGGAVNSAGVAQAAEASGTLSVSDRIYFAQVGAVTSTLVFNHTSTNYVFGTVLAAEARVATASQGLIRQIAGTTRLTGLSSGFTGITQIEGGTLIVDNILGGTVDVRAGGRLAGTGTVGGLSIAGIVAPGNSPGTLTVNGNVSFAAGSTYAVELGAAGTTDRINASGTATLSGGTVAITTLDPDMSYANGASYRILNAAGGRTGTFAGLTETSAFLDFALAYDATGVNVIVSQLRTFPGVAQTFNQRGAANALRDFSQAAGSDALSVYQQILMLDAAPARAAFDAGSGEIYAVSLASTQDQGRVLAARLSSRAFAASGEGWGLWGGASGQTGRVSGDGNGARSTHDAIGGDLGIDYRGAGNRWAVGLSAGRFDSDTTLADRRSRADTGGWSFGGYARLGTGHSGFSGVASLALTDAHAAVQRSIAIGTLSRTVTARTALSSVTASLELRYGFGGGDWAFGPVVAIEHASARIGAFTEAGANALNLSASRQSDSTTRPSIGLFANLQSARGSIDLGARYARDSGDPAEIGLALAGSPTAFRVRSAAGARDTLLLRLSDDYALGGGWSLGGDVHGTFASGTQTIAGAATLRLAF